MNLFLLALLFGQMSVYPTHPGEAGRAVVVGNVGVARGESEPGFDMRLAAELKKHCPDIKVVANPKEAIYFMMFRIRPNSREVSVIKKIDSEVIYAGTSGWSVKKVVKMGCKAIREDASKNQVGQDSE